MRAITKKMVNAALGHSQPRESQVCCQVFGKTRWRRSEMKEESGARNLTRRTGPFLSHSQAYHNMGPPPYYADITLQKMVVSNLQPALGRREKLDQVQ
ncbi:hypothetical protein EVAR_86418_1 [Eumeta japonica]|uniref:Uncharacterized protein n=1 Tax=Eumeta variegata TaxID=151549 RepID=A0A4C1WBG7_EUMVA|nr:hypothetical protein EVAR_86418_1 [Eumeta japonica]